MGESRWIAGGTEKTRGENAREPTYTMPGCKEARLGSKLVRECVD